MSRLLIKAKVPRPLNHYGHFLKYMGHYSKAQKYPEGSHGRTKHTMHAQRHLEHIEKHPKFDDWVKQHRARRKKK